jgi:hypothetical protein
MRNLKNTIAAVTMMAVMAFGAVIANAGILVSDKNANTSCTKEPAADNGILVSDLVEGIIVLGLTDGIIVLGRGDGIIVLGRSEPTAPVCEVK